MASNQTDRPRFYEQQYLGSADLDARDVDLAVHSSKDMPVVLPEGLAIAAVLPREDPRDAVVLPASMPPPEGVDGLVRMLGREPRIGTSSVRRIAQLATLLLSRVVVRPSEPVTKLASAAA